MRCKVKIYIAQKEGSAVRAWSVGTLAGPSEDLVSGKVLNIQVSGNSLSSIPRHQCVPL